MSHACTTAKFAVLTLLTTAVGAFCTQSSAQAQSQGPGQGQGRQPVHFHVSGPAQRLEMIVNTSRILTLDFDAPRLLVNNPAVISATPLAPNQIQVSARTPGITEINIWDSDNNVHSVDVMVYGDARELQDLLNNIYPDARVEVRPSNGNSKGSVILSGYVPRPEVVSRIVTIAQDFYPNVIDNMTVGGVQTVLLHVKVMEVSRTKLRNMGLDWGALFSGAGDYIVQGVNGIAKAAAITGSGGAAAKTGGTMQIALFSGNNSFTAFLDLLRQNQLAKVMAEPTLITISGRPASFNEGGMVPVPVSAGLGVATVRYREFGTSLDFVPIVLGNGKIRLEVRPQVTEIAPDLANGVTGTPGFRNRRVDTAVEMKAGQTLALAGLIQRRVDSENDGIPFLADLPLIGIAFRKMKEQVNEVELLILVTPELVDAMDPHEVPPCAPAQLTGSPSNEELYIKGYVEVPNCCNDGNCGPGGGMGTPVIVPGAMPEPLPPTPNSSANNRMSNRARQYTGRPYNPPAYNAAQYNGRVQNVAPYGTARPSRFVKTSYGAAVPQQGASPAGQNRYVPQNRFGRQAPPPTSQPAEEPGLVGPLGYDVLK